MDLWTLVWLFWLGLFLVFELTAAALKKPTLSRKTWEWFSLRERRRYWLARRIIFTVFWLSLGIGHFMLGGPALWTVILPGIPFATVIVYASFFEDKEAGRNAMFRWDQWKSAVMTSGLMALFLAAPPFFADGRITGSEGVMLAGAFLAGCGLYMKTHPPQE